MTVLNRSNGMGKTEHTSKQKHSKPNEYHIEMLLVLKLHVYLAFEGSIRMYLFRFQLMHKDTGGSKGGTGSWPPSNGYVYYNKQLCLRSSPHEMTMQRIR